MIGATGVVYSVTTREVSTSVVTSVSGGIASMPVTGIFYLLYFFPSDNVARIAISDVSRMIAVGIAIGSATGFYCMTIAGVSSKDYFVITFRIYAAIISLMTSIFISIIVFLVICIYVEVAAGFVPALIIGVVIWVTSGLVMLRIYYLPLAWLMVWPTARGSWYPYHPVAWDQMCTLSFPGLHRLLLAYCDHVPIAGRAEIERLIDTYPSQRWEALKAAVGQVARETGRLRDLTHLNVLLRLPTGDHGFLKQTVRLMELAVPIVERQEQYNRAIYPTIRKQLAELLLADIESFRDQIAGFDEPLASEFRQAAQRWLNLTRKQFATAISGGTEPIPQVFRAADWIARGQEAFVARPTVVGEVERQVLLAAGCPGLILYGRRRTGKSTILRNFTGFLPSSVTVATVSFQNPEAFTSHGHLCGELARTIRAARSWGDALPVDAPESLPDLMRFLEGCDRRLSADGGRLIVALDEYENIDAKIGEKVFTTDLLATLRESIQMHRRIIWVLAGSHEIGELGHAEWSSYLVSARTVEVLPFTLNETTQLLTDPMRHSGLWRANAEKRPKFERGFWGDGMIERIHADAGGWPHLVQLLAERAVDLVNTDGVTGVSDDLYQRAKQKAIVNGDTVLRQLLKGECELPGEWEYLSRFRRVESQPPPDDDEVYRSLKRRLLVEGDSEWRLRVPLMQMWLRERG
jgi:hypothetical protein